MLPDKRFVGLPKSFWAHVRTISQDLGYTARGTGQVCVHAPLEMARALRALKLDSAHLHGPEGPTALGTQLHDYFQYRADVLNKYVEPRLLDAPAASKLFHGLHAKLTPKCPIPMNKQKGDKSGPNFLTGMVNMLVEANVGGLPVDYDPRELTTVTRGGVPLRTLARRVDGCFPSAVNPIAVWEIKEYYYTTTFGSRVADGVYETLLDGMELEELREHEGIDVQHVLMVDSHYTWWECGRSYLCRIVDMLHMGYVDEVLFGAEVIERLPALVREWVARHAQRLKAASPAQST